MGAARSRADWERAILDAIEARRPGTTICPSEVARVHAGASWRDSMALVREIAVDMARRRLIRISQRGVTVEDLDSLRGPIRLSRVQDGD